MDLPLGNSSRFCWRLGREHGIAGIPNSGLIILTLVLKAARLPDETVQLALPIVYSIDFINARLRSAVNVMGTCRSQSFSTRGAHRNRTCPWKARVQQIEGGDECW